MTSRLFASCLLMVVFASSSSRAQTATDLTVFTGLAPVTTLQKTDAGRAALRANYYLTGAIETGDLKQPTLLPFAEQEGQALRDAYITSINLAELSDGLGTTLGGAYVARFHYVDQSTVSAMPDSLERLVNYALSVTLGNANAAKYFFASGTQLPDGKVPVSDEAKDILAHSGGVTDVFGSSYGLPRGAVLGNAVGNARPFQTEREFRRFEAHDYFNRPSNNIVYNYGPAMSLIDSPSFPSGHTTYGFTGSILLAVLIPERYSQMLARGAEYGNDRILMGSHYVMDVLAGRAVALYDMAHLLANDKRYLSLAMGGTPTVVDFQATLIEARKELREILQKGCGKTVSACAGEDTGRFNNESANQAFYSATQTYDLPRVNLEAADTTEDVSKQAPEAGYLLTWAYPSLTLEQADRILTQTEAPGGGFLDNGSDTSFSIYSRLDLYAASKRAVLLAAAAK